MMSPTQAQDGIPTSNLYGSDLRPEFWDLGFDLFCDKDFFKAHFLAADIFAAESPLDTLDGSVDIIQASSFFHLFSRDDQLRAGAKCMKLLKQKQGSMIVGRQMGRPDAANLGHVTTGNKAYWHDEESFHTLWKEIGDAAGLQLAVEMAFEDWRIMNPQGEPLREGSRRLKYTVQIK